MFHGIFGLRKRSNSSSRDRPTRRTAHGECSRRTSIVCRNFGNASNVFFARTFATCSVITKCTTKVCPESIQITDNGIIPLKERVVDDFYDPLGWFWRLLKKKADRKDVD